jgi:hypothetical protein
MMKKIFITAIAIVCLAGLGAVAQAATPSEIIQQGVCMTAQDQATCNSGGLFSGGIFQRIANVLIFITGAISVIMVVIGGLKYVLSQGNPGAVEGAKNTILYAVIGLIIAILAFAIVNFVLAQLGGNKALGR